MTDEFASAYTTLVVATKSRSRYWDGDAVRTAPKYPDDMNRMNKGGYDKAKMRSGEEYGDEVRKHGERSSGDNPAGAPLLDWWLIPDETVVERLVLSMCPRRVCVTCGEPTRRIVGEAEYVKPDGRPHAFNGDGFETNEQGANRRIVTGADNGNMSRVAPTLGWTDCGHNSWRPGVVYDPFQRNENDVITRFLIGDVFDGLATIPDNSVDLIVSSPPFLALRSYLPADHELKPLEIGSEATPGAFLDKLLDVVEACERVLAPHGSLIFELGDTYAGGGDSGWERGEREGRANGAAYRQGTMPKFTKPDGPGWPLDKSKVLVPQLFAIALAYGFNPLTGRTTEPWRVRNTVAWCRPNPPVGRDGDKFRPATSFLTVATKARDRYWDGDAVRVPHKQPDTVTDGVAYWGSAERNDDDRAKSTDGGELRRILANPVGAPLLDYWVIPTEPYSGSHYATFPRALVVPLVKSMCPQKVCRVCGEPSRRIVETTNAVGRRPDVSPTRKRFGLDTDAEGVHFDLNGAPDYSERVTLGWSDCGDCCAKCAIENRDRGLRRVPLLVCEHKWRPGLVLDPFCGSGTTLAVASGHGLDSIGIDIDARNSELAPERVGGLFLEITEIRGAA